MDVRGELQPRGFEHAGAIRSVNSGQSCDDALKIELEGHVVFALVLEDQIMWFLCTSTSLKQRIKELTSAINGILERGRPIDDLFKEWASKAINASQNIDVWAKLSTPSACKLDAGTLNDAYDTERVRQVAIQTPEASPDRVKNRRGESS